MRKIYMVTTSVCLSLIASFSGLTVNAADKVHAIHVRNKTGGRVDFEIRDSDQSKMLVQSYLPIDNACAIFPTDSTQSQWQVRYKKEKGEWTSLKTMKESDGWIDLK